MATSGTTISLDVATTMVLTDPFVVVHPITPIKSLDQMWSTVPCSAKYSSLHPAVCFPHLKDVLLNVSTLSVSCIKIVEFAAVALHGLPLRHCVDDSGFVGCDTVMVPLPSRVKQLR
jgi:hypothetical protein